MKKIVLLLAAGLLLFSCCPQENPGLGNPNPFGTFTDSRDGKVYNIVTIGKQFWMAENLAYLPSVVDPGTGSYTEPYYSVYGYNGTDVAAAKATENYQTYGVLYNWPAAMTACPEGWHLPSDAEWKQMEMALGMSSDQLDLEGTRGSIEGGKMKETGITHWTTPNTGATNSSGFTALPGGARGYNGTFDDVTGIGKWWSSTQYSSITSAWTRELYHWSSKVFRMFYYMGSAFSVRCVRS